MSRKSEINFLHCVYMTSCKWIRYEEGNKIKKKAKCYKLCYEEKFF